VLTDLLTDSDWRTGLRALRAVGQEVTVLQILAPEELKPSLRGDWKLSDVESGSTVEVTISPRVLRRYEEALAAHTQEIREFCRRQGMSFLQIPSSIPLEEATLTSLRLAGVVA
jgi:hypothetical protein